KDHDSPSSTADPTLVADLLRQLAEVVGARNRPDEVGRVLEELAASDGLGRPAPFASRRDDLVLVLARASRRSGRRLAIDPDPARPGAALVVRTVRQASARALAPSTPEPARLGAIAVLSALEPDKSHAVFLPLIDPGQSQAVQVAAVQAMA